MLYTKNNIAVGLAVVVLLTATAAFARNENMNPLTGQIGVDAGDESEAAIKQRSGSGDPVAGKDKSLICQGCHGEVGISADTMIPHLAGQYARDTAKQLRNYQAGTRSHQIMNAMAATISDSDLADIAAYFASQKKMKGNGSSNDLGRKLFLNGDISRTIVGCVNCHGVNGKGLTPSISMFPVIGGQQKGYIRLQLTNFRRGDRANSPNGIMVKVTQKLTDAELEALAEYISAQ